MAQTITAIVHTYWISDKNTDEYRNMCKALEERGLKRFSAYGGNDCEHFKRHMVPLDGQTVELETKHLFDNQWNTAPTATSENGLRVFDWSEPICENKKIAYGYWLEFDKEEVTTLRNTRHECGYCGNQVDHGGICDKCLDDEYLTINNLHLLRLMPVSLGLNAERPALTGQGFDELVARFTDAQIHGQSERGRKRLSGMRAKLVTERDKAIANANAKHDGFMWLMDHGINIDNFIYYDHTAMFGIGWRKKLSAAEAKAMRAALEGFTWSYNIEEV
jgi:hypothetical protein